MSMVLRRLSLPRRVPGRAWTSRAIPRAARAGRTASAAWRHSASISTSPTSTAPWPATSRSISVRLSRSSRFPSEKM